MVDIAPWLLACAIPPSEQRHMPCLLRLSACWVNRTANSTAMLRTLRVLQAALSSLHHELSVLDTIPEGGVGRVVAGDTLLDDLRASEQQLTAELEGLQQEAAEDQVSGQSISL